MNFLYFLPLILANNDYKEAVHGDKLRHQMLDQTPARTEFDRVYQRWKSTIMWCKRSKYFLGKCVKWWTSVTRKGMKKSAWMPYLAAITFGCRVSMIFINEALLDCMMSVIRWLRTLWLDWRLQSFIGTTIWFSVILRIRQKFFKGNYLADLERLHIFVLETPGLFHVSTCSIPTFGQLELNNWDFFIFCGLYLGKQRVWSNHRNLPKADDYTKKLPIWRPASQLYQVEQS